MRVELSSPVGPWLVGFQDNGWSSCLHSRDPLLTELLLDSGKSLENDKTTALNEFQNLWNDYWRTGISNFSSIPMSFDSATPFQRQVWTASLAILSGTVCSYGALSEAINRKNAAHATGTALGRNPLLLGIPCHRVLPAQDLPTFEKWIKSVKPQLGVPIHDQKIRFEHLQHVLSQQCEDSYESREHWAQSVVGKYRLGSYLKLLLLTHEFWV